MAEHLFPYGLPHWADLAGGTFKWMLAGTGWTPDTTTERYVADISADEIVHGSYSRQTLTGGTETVSAADGTVTYDANNPTFTALAGGATTAWVVLYRFVTNDADSVLLAAWPVSHVNGGTDYTPSISPAGLVVFEQVQVAAL